MANGKNLNAKNAHGNTVLNPIQIVGKELFGRKDKKCISK